MLRLHVRIALCSVLSLVVLVGSLDRAGGDDPTLPNCPRGASTVAAWNWGTQVRMNGWEVYDPAWNIVGTMEEPNGWVVSINAWTETMEITVPEDAVVADDYLAVHGDGVDPTIGVRFDVVSD